MFEFVESLPGALEEVTGFCVPPGEVLDEADVEPGAAYAGYFDVDPRIVDDCPTRSARTIRLS